MKLDAPELRHLGLEANAITHVWLGSPVHVRDPRTGWSHKARYIVADELTILASEAAKAGRPDRCGLLNSIITRIRVGKHASKRQLGKARREIDEAERRLTTRQPQAQTEYPIPSRYG